MANTLVTKSEPIPIRHREGCPAGSGQIPRDANGDEVSYRLVLGIEVYPVVVGGRYNRTTGEYAPPGRAGVVRCIECAEQVLVPIETIPEIHKQLQAAFVAQEEPIHA